MAKLSQRKFLSLIQTFSGKEHKVYWEDSERIRWAKYIKKK
jgi:hypothetical protein